MPWFDITEDLSAKGKRKIKVGQVLIFDYEGSPVYLKIMSKSDGRVKAKKLDPDKFLTPEDADDQVMVVPKK